MMKTFANYLNYIAERSERIGRVYSGPGRGRRDRRISKARVEASTKPCCPPEPG